MAPPHPDANFKRELCALTAPNHPYDLVIGVDEAGRGPLAGPVVAGAFCFFTQCADRAGSMPPGWPWNRIGDSKGIGEEEREYLFDAFIRTAQGQPAGDPPEFRRQRKGSVAVKALCQTEAEEEEEEEEEDVKAAATKEGMIIKGDDESSNETEYPLGYESRSARLNRVRGRPRGVRPPKKVKPKSDSDTTRSQRRSVKKEESGGDDDSSASIEPSSTIKVEPPLQPSQSRNKKKTKNNGTREKTDPLVQADVTANELAAACCLLDSEYDCDISEYTETRRGSITEAMLDMDEDDEEKEVVSTSTTATSEENVVVSELSSADVVVSKKLQPDTFVDDCPILYAFSTASPEEIDRVNILEATMRSMTRAVYKVLAMALPRLGKVKDTKIKVLVDGNRKPHLMEPGMLLTDSVPAILTENNAISPSEWKGNILTFMRYISSTPIVKGDALVASISAASIVAKVVRDRMMRALDAQYPQYLLSINKGYPTPEHQAIVRKIGPSAIHRLSFAPIFQLLKDKHHQCPPGRDFDEILTIKASKSKKRPSSKPTAAAPKKPRKV